MSKSYLFVDEANLYLATKKKGWKISWRKFLRHLESRFDIRAAFLYEGMPTERSVRANIPNASNKSIQQIKAYKKAYFSKLRDAGYTVRHKPVSTVNGSNKCNFDVEITVDAIDKIDDYDICILATGDGDFIRLVKYLRGKGKTMYIIGPKKANKELKLEARGNFETIDGMRSYIQKQ